MAGRPRSFDRDAALERALDAFWEHGFEATSIAHLTAAMGIAAPSLYAAFGDKQRLFDEAVGRYCARLEIAMGATLDAPTARDGVEAMLRATAAAHTAREHPRGCLVMSEPRLTAVRDGTRATITARLRRAQEEGELPAATDPAALAGLIDMVIAGMSARARDGADRAELDAAIDQLMLGWPARAEA